MPHTEECESITLSLPRSLVAQLDELASARSISRDQEVQTLIEDRLRRQSEGQSAFNRLSDMYRSRMARESKADQTDEEVMEDLRRIREEVANDLAAE